MQDSMQTPLASHELAGARDLQAKLYREIGISAVAAALHSISKPEPGKSATDLAATRSRDGRGASRAA